VTVPSGWPVVSAREESPYVHGRRQFSPPCSTLLPRTHVTPPTPQSRRNRETDKFDGTCFIKEYMSDPVTNYNYIEDAKVSVSIKKLMPTNAH